MKNKTFLQSIICALNGLEYAIKTEKNFKWYLGIYFSFLIIDLVLNIELIGYLITMIMTIGVFSSECVNTSIEHIANKITIEKDADIKIIKDIAASSVLIWGFGFFITQIIMIVRVFL